jgi:oligopeptide/dipeptide ABC transporter ATP-binding protein
MVGLADISGSITARPPDARKPVAGAAHAQTLLDVRGLSVAFKTSEGELPVTRDISFSVTPGERVGIVGESGCGKSVTMKAILQLVEQPGRITGGEILYRRDPAEESMDLVRLPPRGQTMRALRGADIALIPQEPMAAFSPVHTVGEQIVEAIMLHGSQRYGRTINRREARAITVDLFRDVGISMPEQRLDAYSWQLSGGLRQRAMIAMALSCKPRLLIADEPTTAIDVTTQAQILALLRELQRKYDTAIIFITHDLGVIAQMANYVVVMYLGRVMEEGPVDEIFHAPRHPYTRALLRSIPSMQGETRTALPIIKGTLPHPFNRPSGCPFHPRCDDVMPDRCPKAVPVLHSVGQRRAVSCFLHSELAEPA